jgi:hypothetical protein
MTQESMGDRGNTVLRPFWLQSLPAPLAGLWGGLRRKGGQSATIAVNGRFLRNNDFGIHILH